MKIIGYILLGIVVALLRGYVTLSLWDWFLVPLGAPVIIIWHAMGIALLAGFVTKEIHVKKQEPADTVHFLVTNIVWALLVFGLGAMLNLLTIDLTPAAM